jgi:prepilin-type N-terminal cleavage/methylation domain-containing protein
MTVLTGKSARPTGQSGFTLVELIVAMAVFISVIVIASSAFNTIISQSGKLMREEESSIEGIIGLEILRHDLEQAGFGLSWDFGGTPFEYNEAVETFPKTLNDAPTNVPRPLTMGNNLDAASGMVEGSDYLVIRGTTVGRSQASQRWTYLTYSSVKKPPRNWPSGNIPVGARVIMLRRTYSENAVTNQLVHNGNTFAQAYSATGFDDPFKPALPQETFYVYGVDDGDKLQMPFNRADYFVKKPDPLMAGCAQETGTFYKATVNHADGKLNSIPLLDCVADMQVVLGWDINGDGTVDTWSSPAKEDRSGVGSEAEVQSALGTAATQRAQLKLVKVYLLAQEGRRDLSYKVADPKIVVGNKDTEKALTHEYTLSTEQQNYRWKVYRVVVRPKNLTGQ